MERGVYAPFPPDEYEIRVGRLRKVMAEKRLDGLLLTSKENVIYFSGIQARAWDSKHRPLGLIISGDARSPVLIVAEAQALIAYQTSWIDDIRPWGGVRDLKTPKDPVTAMKDALRGLQLSTARIGMELGYGTRLGMTQSDLDVLRAALPDMVAVDGAPAVWDVRVIKSPREIQCLRLACEATSRAFAAGFSTLRPGMTERELAGVFYRELASTNYRPGFVMIRSGPLKYRMMNVEPYDKPLEPGDLVVADAGAMHKDYWADFMRMACIGEPTREQRTFFDCELEAQSAGVQAVRPGAPLRTVVEACTTVIANWGLSMHAPIERVGHSLGLDLHEPPSIAWNNETVMEEGMVLTVEPVFWDLPDGRIGNFALEDVVVVTSTGHEVLSTFPKALWIV